MLRIKQKHTNEIIKHGEADYPYECCGMFIGRFADDGTKILEEILPISNAREEKDKRNRFLITPEEFMRGESAARKNKMDVLGFYHSHPDHPAVPSQFDLEHAWPGYSYLIVSVNRGKAGEINSWEMEKDRSGFNP